MFTKTPRETIQAYLQDGTKFLNTNVVIWPQFVFVT
jgi:hypothetical protein